MGAVLLPQRAQAQAEWSRWYFGHQAALRFTPDSAIVLQDSRMVSEAASATICDSTGRLLLYSNGRRVWNGRHQLLVNGERLGGDSTSSQGCALVPNPRRRGYYFLFTLDGWFTQQRRGLRVAEINVNAANGQGSVLSLNQPVVPDTLLQRLGNRDFMEMQALVRHANGHDYWLVTHLLDTNVFLSVLVTGNGFSRSSIVVSSVGLVHHLAGNANSRADMPGALAVSANGRRLALTSQILGAEVFDFNPGNGRVTNPIRLGYGIYSEGIAFSPDGSLLYQSRRGPGSGFGHPCSLNAICEVRQFDLRLSTPAAVAASGILVYIGCGRQVVGMQRAIDGRIYLASMPGGDSSQPNYNLDVIAQPNVRGSGCQYRTAAVALVPSRYIRHFPVVPNEPPQPRLQALGFSAVSCAGQPVVFTLMGNTLGASGDTLDWNFGDGATLRTTLPQASHLYAQTGTYAVTVRLRNRSFGPDEQLRGSVSVVPRPALNLGPDVTVCPGTAVLLSVGTLGLGTTVRWNDGSTAATRPAVAPGLFWAEVTTAGCSVRDTIVLNALPAPVLRLTASQPLCATGQVELSAGPQPAGSRYRWQDGSTEARFVARTAGSYALTVVSPGGCEARASLELGYDPSCPLVLPNIITPNGDALNQTFVLRGLQAPDWSIRIYNRWGREIYTKTQYDNAWAAQGQPDGQYYYLLTNAATGQQYKGWVEVAR
ncbi:hypothetical protein GCM10023185_06340 [Hymenobacter saemangeumensis]|uniref:PKD domain-containing protein n=2 Tax=Hymenobacter saemangeumensis TaxID=1084522 RepID=A0ABP8I1W1_9BACT